MNRLSNALKTAAFAGLIATGALATSPASAATYTRCGHDGCYQVHCDWDGANCYRVSGYYGSGYYPYRRPDYDRDRRVWLCDRDGEHCRWTYRSEPRVHVGVGIGF